VNGLVLTDKPKPVISISRWLLAVLSLAGFAASIVIYIASFRGLTLDRMGIWAFALHVGIFLPLIPLYAIEYPAIRDRTFFRDGFKRDKPRWAVPLIQSFALFFIVHFVLFFLVGYGASPKVVDGKFVLDNHGQIKKLLTESEFLSLKGYELRIFATGWMFFYSVSTIYWWFSAKKKQSFSN
jgi:hypothetical protein